MFNQLEIFLPVLATVCHCDIKYLSKILNNEKQGPIHGTSVANGWALGRGGNLKTTRNLKMLRMDQPTRQGVESRVATKNCTWLFPDEPI